MRAIKLLSAVVAAFLLVLPASTAATAAPGSPDGGLSTAACGATHSEWVGTFQGSVTSTQGGGTINVRAVIYQGGGDLLVDTYANGELEGKAAVPWYDGSDIRWNTSTGLGPMLYSFGPTACSGGHITKASAFRQWFWPCCHNWDGTVNRKS